MPGCKNGSKFYPNHPSAVPETEPAWFDSVKTVEALELSCMSCEGIKLGQKITESLYRL